jgi:hypothetical protein
MLNRDDLTRLQAEAAQVRDPRATIEFGLVETVLPHQNRVGSAWLMIVGGAFVAVVVAVMIVTKI